LQLEECSLPCKSLNFRLPKTKNASLGDPGSTSFDTEFQLSSFVWRAWTGLSLNISKKQSFLSKEEPQHGLSTTTLVVAITSNHRRTQVACAFAQGVPLSHVQSV